MKANAAQTRFGKLFSFAAAGGSGLLIELGVLHALLTFTPLGPFISKVIAIACAMTSNFVINRTFTFGASDGSLLAEAVKYASVASVGAVINFAVYSAILLLFPGFSPLIATVIGVGIAAVFSYLGFSRFVFVRRRQS